MKTLLLIICLSLSVTAFTQTPALQQDALGAKLFQSSCNGDFQGVTTALTKGAAIDWKSPEGYTPLLCAAKDGHLSIVEYLVANGAQINKHDNDRGKTPLLAAAFQGQLAVVQYLIGQHALLNVQAKNGWTALHDGAYIGNLSICRALAGAGASLTLHNQLGETPLATAQRALTSCQKKLTSCPTTRGDSSAKLSDYKATTTYLRGISK